MKSRSLLTTSAALVPDSPAPGTAPSTGAALWSAKYFVQCDRDKQRLTKRLLRRLRELGVDVEVKGKAA